MTDNKKFLNTESFKKLLQIDLDRFLQRDKCGKGWTCPACNSGQNGHHGTGLKQYGTGSSARYTCFAESAPVIGKGSHGMGVTRDAVQLYAIQREISHLSTSQIAEQMAREYGIEWITGLPGGGVDWDEIKADEKKAAKVGAREFLENVPREKKNYSPYIYNCRQILENSEPESMAWKYLEERGIDESTAKKFNLGFYPDYSLKGKVYPVITIPASPSFVFQRNLAPNGPKYINLEGSTPEIFNVLSLKNPNKRAFFITEGVWDTLTIEQFGFPAIALPSAGGTKEFERELHEIQPVDKAFILCLDTDKAGRDAATEVEALLKKAGYKVYYPADLLGAYKDANELAQKASIEELGAFAQRLEKAYKTALELPDPKSKPKEGQKQRDERSAFLMAELAKMKACKLPLTAIRPALTALNQEECFPPLNPEELEAEVINRYTKIAAKTPEGLNAIGEAAYQIATAPKLEFLTGRDLEEMPFKERVWLVEGLIPEGGLVMLCADPKSYKSWMCLDMANSIADGQLFMDKFHTSKARVMYFDLEADNQSGHERLALLNYNGMKPASENLLYVKNKSETRTFGNGLEVQLLEALEDYPGTKLIILDTLQMIKGTSGKGQNAYEKDVKELAPIRDFAYANGITILVVHHTNKMGQGASVFSRINGSNGTYGTVTTALLLEQKDGFGTLHTNGKTGKSESYSIHFDNHQYRWICDGTAAEFKRQTEADEFEESDLFYVINQLADNPNINGISAKAIIYMAREEYGRDLGMKERAVGKAISNKMDLLAQMGIKAEKRRSKDSSKWFFTKMSANELKEE